jgi:hypothetical protein
VRHLEKAGLVCTYAGDLSAGQDALAVADFGAPVITNPPWSRGALHALIAHFMASSPFAWLLFDADWSHTRQSRDLIRHCTDVVPIGRLRWIPDSKFTGKDNAAWHRFTARHSAGPILHGRGAEPAGARICGGCGRPFRALRSDGRHCSPACRQQAYRERLSVTQA